jgi:hypothetical protein
MGDRSAARFRQVIKGGPACGRLVGRGNRILQIDDQYVGTDLDGPVEAIRLGGGGEEPTSPAGGDGHESLR